MQRYKLFATVPLVGFIALWSGHVYAEDFTARLDGFQELGALNNQTGAILADGTGTLKLDLDRKAKTIRYKLTFSNVGTTPPKLGTVTVAHIHFGKNHTSGNVLVFFCSTVALPATFTGPTPPTCPQNGGTLTGTFMAANVQAIPTQNVVAGDFDALADALASNTAYANVHTTALAAGEIRGQIRKENHDDNGDMNHQQR